MLRDIAAVADAEQLIAEQIPDVAVVDINLKGDFSYRLIDQLHDRGVPVVVVSGYAVLPQSAEKAAAILQKPFSGQELLAILRRVMRQGKTGQV